MKRRTKAAQVRAARRRADKPSGKSHYARKRASQANGKFSRTSPFMVGPATDLHTLLITDPSNIAGPPIPVLLLWSRSANDAYLRGVGIR